MIYAWSEAWISPKIFVFDTMQATSQAAGTQQKLTSIVCALCVCMCVHAFVCVCVCLCMCVSSWTHIKSTRKIKQLWLILQLVVPCSSGPTGLNTICVAQFYSELSGQLPVVRCQLPLTSHQFPIASCQFWAGSHYYALLIGLGIFACLTLSVTIY